MRALARIAGVLLLAAPLSAAAGQTSRWNDRAFDSWTEQAPRVQVWIESGRVAQYGGPVHVRYQVDQDAYVVVGRVAGDGRLTILFPTSRTQRSFVRGGTPHRVYGRRAGNAASFYAVDNGSGGFVFALASERPIDLSRFETRDFERIGSMSRFNVSVRRYVYRPDEFMDRFAAAVMWDNNTPYDYDVDYYVTDTFGFANSLAICHGYNRLMYDWDDSFYSSVYGHPYASMCRSYFNSYLRCIGLSVYGGYALCSPNYYDRPTRFAGREPGPQSSTPDTAKRANIGIVRGGLWAPDTVSRAVDSESRDSRVSQLREGTRESSISGLRDREWDRLYAIPQRAVNGMRKASDGERQGKSNTDGGSMFGAPGKPSSAGGVSEIRKSANTESKASADRPQRSEPPPREQTRASAPERGRDRDFGYPPRMSTPTTNSTRPQNTEPKTQAAAPRAESPPATSTQGIKAQSGATEPKKPPPQH